MRTSHRYSSKDLTYVLACLTSVVRKMTAYSYCGGLACSSFVLTEHISSIIPFYIGICLEWLAHTKNGCGLTPPKLRIGGMRYYYSTRTSIHIYICTASAQICTPLIVSRSLAQASKRSERDTIRGVQIRMYGWNMYGGTCAIIVAHATYT